MTALPRIVRTVADLRAEVARWRSEGDAIGLCPTMGALHQGHLSLLRVARRRARRVVASIFVNPTQFGPGEDFEAYPRDEARDAAMLAEIGCDLIYAPEADEMYRSGFATSVRVSGLSEVLCGAHRPGHFDGVALVVSKLLAQAQADVAVFGEKDWQQLVTVRAMSQRDGLGVEIIACETARERDGLAMSSRNAHLAGAHRVRATALHEALLAAASEPDPRGAEAAMTRTLRSRGVEQIAYACVRDAETLGVYHPGRAGRALAAAVVGGVRLLDNAEWPGSVG